MIEYIEAHDIDIVCLSESSNFNFSECLPERFPYEHSFLSSDTYLGKRGYKFNICSSKEVTYTPVNYYIEHELFNSDYDLMLKDYGQDTIISIKVCDKEIVPVHIQYPGTKYSSPYTLYYELGIRTLINYMENYAPIVVCGDFNNYPGDTTFGNIEQLKSYRNANTDINAYSYIASQGSSKLLLDHTFTNSNDVKMEYVPAIEKGVFDHNGMLITL